MKKRLFYLKAVVIVTAVFAACTADITTIPMEITLDYSSVKMIPGETHRLTADVVPDEAHIKTLTWSSTDTSVVTVTDGVVTAVAEGEAIINVITNSGQKSAFCRFTVAYPVESIKLNQTLSILTLGKSMTLTATVLPESAPDRSVLWESSAPNVAEVNEHGEVIAKAPGTAIITVTTEVGRRVAVCTVKVPSENHIAMIWQPYESTSIFLIGSGTVDVDWGDGTASEKVTLSTVGTYIMHSYSDMSAYAVIINFNNNITRFDCLSKRLTSLNISANTSLTSLNCSQNQLTSLNISANTSLTTLYCDNNQLTSLELSANPELTILNCSNNRLTSLEMSSNSKLITLNCTNNRLTSLDVNANPELTNFNFANNPLLSSLVVKNTKLKNLDASNLSLTNLELNNNLELTTLNCSNNRLTSLDISSNLELTALNLANNPLLSSLVVRNTKLKSLDLRNLPLTSLDVSSNPELTTLNCNNNKLSVNALNNLFVMLPVVAEGLLHIENNPGTADCNTFVAENKGWILQKLPYILLTLQSSGNVYIQLSGQGTAHIDWGDGTSTSGSLSAYSGFSHIYYDITYCTIRITGENILGLHCSNNQLTSLELSNNISLTSLNVGGNQLTSLNINGATALRDLYCYGNQLTSLDVSGCTALSILNCSGNQLTSLDVKNNTALTSLDCYSNQFSSEALNALFVTLHNNFVNWGYKWVNISYNPGTADCDRSIATSKGWIFN